MHSGVDDEHCGERAQTHENMGAEHEPQAVTENLTAKRYGRVSYTMLKHFA